MKTSVLLLVSLLSLGTLTQAAVIETVSNMSNLNNGLLWMAFAPVYASFTLGSNNVNLDSMDFGINADGFANSDGTIVYTATIYSDNSGSIGTPIQTVGSFTDTSIVGNENITISATSALTLFSNTTYWVQLSVGSGDSGYWLTTGDASQTGSAGWSIGDSSTWNGGGNPPTRFSVTGTVVPEPSSMLLMAAIPAGYFGFSRRRRA